MQEIVVYYDKGHFDLITSKTGYFGYSFYCDGCEKAYSHRARHRCDGNCHLCYRLNEECEATNSKKCDDCQREFRNPECFRLHKVQDKKQKSLCDKIFVCKRCNFFVSMIQHDQTHVCGKRFCKTCERHHSANEDHKCYISKTPEQSVERNPKYIFFDAETFNDPEKGHVPNLIIAQYCDGTEFRFPEDGAPMNGDVTDLFGR